MDKKIIYIRDKYYGYLNEKELHDLYSLHPDIFDEYVTECYNNHRSYYNDVLHPFLTNQNIPKPPKPDHSPKNPVNPGKKY